MRNTSVRCFAIRVSGEQLEPTGGPRPNSKRGYCTSEVSSYKGFFTTRYAWTDSRAKAESLALEMVEREMKELAPKVVWELDIAEVWEDTERLRKDGSGKGFTFYL